MTESGGDPALLHRNIAGKFVIEKFLGGGAMGAVYRAAQVSLDRKVAVKVMHRTLATDEAFVKRFKREAKAASKLDHPNSMRIIDYGEEPDGLLYIAMEYLEGRDLFLVIHEDWPLSNERIADVVMQALAAIAVAHDEGVIHRDLKPENIMILRGKDDEGRPGDVVKVCDFGIAKITESDETPASVADPAAKKLTTQGLVVGTPEYMSPEQAKGEKLDSRSDLYSVGVILYQLLTGRTPFVAETPLAVVLKHISEVPTPPSTIYAAVHKGLEAVCLKAIEKDRDKRFQDARQMRAAIRAAMDGRPMPAPTIAHATTEPLLPVAAPSGGPPAPPPPIATPAPVPASSKVTPLGTEAAPSAKRRGTRSASVAIAVALVAGLGGAGGFVVYAKRAGRAAPPSDPTPKTTLTAEPSAVPSASPSEAPRVTPEPTTTTSAEPRAARDHERKRDPRDPAPKHAEPAVPASAAPEPPASVAPTPPPPPAQPDPPPDPKPRVDPTPPAPPTPAFDARKCKSAPGKPQSRSAGATADKVRLGNLPTIWTQCAQKLGEKPSGAASVRLRYDEEGRLKSASCADCPHAMKPCVESARGGSRLVATGEAGEFEVPLNLTCD